MAAFSWYLCLVGSLVVVADAFSDCGELYTPCNRNKDCCSDVCNIVYNRCVPRKKGYKKEVTIDGEDYMIVHKRRLTWAKAKDYCEQLNMNLLSLDKKGKFKSISAYLHNERFVTRKGRPRVYWTSGNSLHTPGEFIWEPSEKEIYEGLWRRPPSDDYELQCVKYTYRKPGYIQNTKCSQRLNFICESSGRDIRRPPGVGDDLSAYSNSEGNSNNYSDDPDDFYDEHAVPVQNNTSHSVKPGMSPQSDG